jgi:hypothetical protein
VTLPLVIPMAKALSMLHTTDSFLNKFVYTSGLDAN